MKQTELSRVKAFRQLKRAIQGSKTHLIVGIDVAKERHHAFLGTADGKTLLKKLIFGNTSAGFSELLARVEAVRAQSGLSDIVFGLEPTSNYHKPLGRYLIDKGCRVVLVGGTTVNCWMNAGTNMTPKMLPTSPTWSPGGNAFTMTGHHGRSKSFEICFLSEPV